MTRRRLVQARLAVVSLMGLSVLAFSLPGDTDAAIDAYLDQRTLFVDARNALAEGRADAYQQGKADLSGYPLLSYLVYEELKGSWRSSTPGKPAVAALNAFEQQYADRALTRKLTQALQSRLIETRQWSLFLKLGKSGVAAKMPCATLRARFETGRLKRFDKQSLALWSDPVKQPELCAHVIAVLQDRNPPPVKAIWQRIYAALDKDKPDFAESVLGYLGKADRAPVKAWLQARQNPGDYLQSGALTADNPLNRRILVNLLLKWSKDDTVAAMNHWLLVRDTYRFYSDRFYETTRALVMRSAYRRLPEAYGWLDTMQAREDDLELKEWRVRAALFQQDWLQVIRSIHRLPKEEQQEDHWAYWEARALQSAGHESLASDIYAKLAGLQSYYGFLSADRLGLDYAIENVPIDATPAEIAALSQRPTLIRAREYHRVGLAWEGRREWNSFMEQASIDELAAGAVLAQRWDLHDRAIFSAGRAERKQALNLRFPVVYQSAVAHAATANKLEPAWVFGVIRRESAYIPDVRSGAGAVGLMQLMPRTARYVAKLQGKKDWRGDLTDTVTNIGFGSFYLRHVMDKFDDHVVLATASYNAGPHRVSQWLPDNDMNADVWIDSIPYTETRRYVRAVLAYTAIYEWHLTRKPRRLADKLRVVPASENNATAL